MKGTIRALTVDESWSINERVECPEQTPLFYATHLDCKSDHKQDDSWLSTESPKCWYCHERIPDEVQALMILRTGRTYGQGREK